MRYFASVAIVGMGVLLAGGLVGCVERTIKVTSTPPGARVWLNDRDIGTTPAQAVFTYHGVYDVRLELPGYTPVHEGRKAKAPVYEWPLVDLVAEVMPVRLENTHEWHFDLVEHSEAGLDADTADAALLERAGELKARAADESGE